jgi:hypothetical protein
MVPFSFLINNLSSTINVLPAISRGVSSLLKVVFVGGLSAAAVAPLPCLGAGQPPSPHLVDTEIVLRIGPHELSRYAVEKNVARLAADSRRFGQPPVLSDARLRAFELLLAKQVIIADALSAGYHKRSEAVRIVNNMERHMLGQMDGPLYQTLARSALPSDEELRRLYSQTAFVPDVVAIRMPVVRRGDLGADWPQLDSASRLTRLRQLQKAPPDIIFHEGPLLWPRGPFSNMEDALQGSRDGTWLENATGDSFTVLYVKSTRTVDLPPFAERRESFAKLAERRKLQELRATRKARLLSEAKVAINDRLLRPMADLLRLIKTPQVPLEPLEAMKAETVATYFVGGAKIDMDVAGWCERFNQQLIRRIPSTPAELRHSIEEMITVDIDIEEARRLGLDKEPRFVEDRQNFLHHQALDLFEKERLIPQIAVSEADIAAYRTEHAADYSAVVEARGVSLRFDTSEDAAAWAGRHRVVTEESLLDPSIKDRTAWVLTRDNPPPELAQLVDPLLRSPDHSSLGPMQTPLGWAVFVKQVSVREPLPLSAVESQIRQLLTRKRLDELELRLARESARKYEVVDNIDYAKFGFSKTPERPWRVE